MVRSSFFGLEIGRTGLTTAQFGLDVTGHNIANLDTDGYTRQRVVSSAYDPYSTIGKFAPVNQALVGGGVRIQILDQIRSAYLDRKFRDENGSHAFWETRSQSLSYVRSFFDNVNEKTSINYTLAAFFESMTKIAADPVSGAPRTLMQTAAMDLVQQLNMVYEGLIDFQKVENHAIETKIGDVNTMAKDIAALNVAIYTFEITGLIANDLRDKRNLLIDKLATYIDIEYEEYPDKFGASMLRIRTAGDTLVDHDWPKSDVFGLALTNNELPGEEQVWTPYWLNRVNNDPTSPNYFDPRNPDPDMLEGAKLNMNLIVGGQLKAHFGMRDGIGGTVDGRDKGIPYYIEMINDLARALVQEINTVHREGWSDNPTGSKTGINFFHEDNAWVTWVNSDATVTYEWDADLGVWTDGVNIITRDPDTGAFVDGAGVPITGLTRRLDVSQITGRNITLSQDIQDSQYNIAASNEQIGVASVGNPTELQRGNNENMLELYKLFSKTTITVEGRQIGSLDEYCTTIRFDVGVTMHTAEQAKETARILTLAADNQRTAIAGVSLDEEMVGLVRYNHAYNGAARVITAMDDALDRLINGTGRVGL